jgi:hypothetical protein
MKRPYETRADAAYWGGGVVAEAAEGGWWSLHGRGTPNGPELTAMGRDGERDGWPPLATEHVWATPDDGGPPCICTDTGDER